MGCSRVRRTHGAGDGAPARPAALLAAVLLLAGCAQEPLRIEPPVFTAAQPQPTPTISRSPRPLENIRNLDLRSQILADTAVPATLRDTVRGCTVCGLGDPVYTDLTKDRGTDVLVPIEGFNGPAGYVAYTVVDGSPRLIFAYDNGKAVTSVDHGDLVVREKLYADGDPACCATGPERTRRWTWNGQRMILTGTVGDAPGFHPYDTNAKVVT